MRKRKYIGDQSAVASLQCLVTFLRSCTPGNSLGDCIGYMISQYIRSSVYILLKVFYLSSSRLLWPPFPLLCQSTAIIYLQETSTSPHYLRAVCAPAVMEWWMEAVFVLADEGRVKVSFVHLLPVIISHQAFPCYSCLYLSAPLSPSWLAGVSWFCGRVFNSEQRSAPLYGETCEFKADLHGCMQACNAATEESHGGCEIWSVSVSWWTVWVPWQWLAVGS